MHGLPVLNALRDALPQAFIAWVVEGNAGKLLTGHAALNEVISAPRKWLKSPRATLDLRRRMRALRFDVAIDLQGLMKSSVAAWLSGAQRRIGFDGADGREISRWVNTELITPTRTHVIDRNLELLAPLGITQPGMRFRLEDHPSDAAAAQAALAARLLVDRFAVINPGAGWPSKVWPASRYAEGARHLGTRKKLRSLVVWAGEQEKRWAEQIVANSGGHAVLAPPTTLRELAAVTRRAVLFVGSDTGPLHLAVAVGTPSVGLFGPMPAERNGPYGEGHIALQNVCLQGTNRERRTADNASMQAISVGEVAAACEQILGRVQPARLSA
jgi:heptosyltransferase I